MRSRRSPLSSHSHSSSTMLRPWFVRGWRRRRALCIVLIAGLLIVPDAGYVVRAASEVAVQVAKDTVAPVPLAVRWFKRLFRRSAKPRAQETTADRSARVSSIQITPAKIVGYQNQRLPFTALGRDANGDVAQGARFTWSSSDTSRLQIDDAGQATLLNPGLVWVTAATANVSARVPVLIKAGARPMQSDSEWRNEQDQLRPDGTVSTTTGGVGALLDSIAEGLMPTAHAQTNGGDSGDFGYDELWSEPRNLVGSPRNRIMTSSVIGTVLPEGSNFEFSVPIWSLPGRGLPLNVAMNYNSRIWSRHGSAVTFNAVNSWPFLGFSLSFGRILTYASGSNTKFVLIDSDGTRHYLGSGPGGTTQTYQTNDGSHITYVGNATSGGTLYYNSGLQKTVSLWNNRLLVTQLTDTNGNYISIAYAFQSAPCTDNTGKVGYVWNQAISSITDTLGRVISFNYDCLNYLTSITAPGQNGSSTTVAQFDYAMTYPSTSFSGLTVENVPSGKPVPTLSHVYFPETNTGYKFTYSAYGMITNVSLRKGMSYNSSTGVISDGTEKAYVSNNYPTTASSLTDAPSFSQWTQSPAATSGGTATWSFTSSTDSGAQTKTFSITQPDSSILWLMRDTNSSNVSNGLLVQSGIYNMTASVLTYANDGGGQPQVQSVTTYDNTGTPTKVDFDYDSYGNVTNTREYGYQQSGSWVVRRRTHAVYKTDTSYVNAYLRSLVIESDTYDAQLDTNDANDVPVAKSTFTFDDYNAMSGMEDYGGTAAPPGHLTSYGTTRTVRGNMTGRSVWYDIAGNLSYAWLRKIDIFGNVTQEQLTCCNVQTTTFGATNDYALAEGVTKGASGGPQVTMSATYNFNTSAADTTTDANGLVTTVNSRDNLLRPTQITLPTGETEAFSYNDSTPSVSASKSYNDGGTQRTITTTTDYDNWGRTIHQTNKFGGQVNTEYDNMGRVARVSNPFAIGGSPSYWTSYSYDALGRQTTVTLQDSQTVTTSYNGNSVTVTDQVNRQMQRLSDGLGRLVTVNEQDSSGSLTQATNYTYDVLNNLTQVNQGNQLRSYRYDAMSRLTGEKIPEQGDPTQASQWTTQYTYTDFDQVLKRTDARGVETHYAYDSLHRLIQVWYTGTGGNDSGSNRPALPSPVAATPDVTYTYDSDSNYGTTAAGKLLRVNVGTDYQERYTFDSDYRTASVIRTIGTRSYTITYNSYNDDDQLMQMTYPSGQALYFRHDSMGNVSGLSNYASGGNGTDYVITHSHNIDGQVGSISYGNGVTEQFGYDAARLQMTSQKAGTASPYTNRLDLTYTYNATTTGKFGVGTTTGNPGQLLSVSGTINGTTESASYTYDNYGRLATSSQISNGSSAQRRFAYDRWGNRTGVWDATNGGTQIQSVSLQTVSFPSTGSAPTNRISSVTSGGTVSYSYEVNGSGIGNGNVANDGQHSYAYDGENRLVSVDGGTTASYAYDHQNLRYKATVGSSVTHYIWRNGQVLAEHNGSTGAVLVDYLYAGTRMIARIASSTTTYLLSDRLSARLTLSTSGTVVGRQGHLPFGEDFAESGTQQKQHFTSYERDSQSGTDYAMNRHYASSVGRFGSADPFHASAGAESPQSWNRYAYVMNAPVDLVDRLGLNEEAPSPEDPCNNEPAPREPLYINLFDLSWRVAAFFAEKPNCLAYFRDTKKILKPFLATARRVLLADFEKDPHNKEVAMGHTFREVWLVSHPSAGANIFKQLSNFNAASWIPEEVVTIGAEFYDLSRSEPARNRTIVHEVLHHFYQTLLHRPIAKQLFGYTGGEGLASQYITVFLDSDCTNKEGF